MLESESDEASQSCAERFPWEYGFRSRNVLKEERRGLGDHEGIEADKGRILPLLPPYLQP